MLLLLLFSHPVMSDSLRSHGLQQARPLCPTSSPGVCPSSCLLHWWCHPAISSSDTLFSTGGENGKLPQYICHENLMNCLKRLKWHYVNVTNTWVGSPKFPRLLRSPFSSFRNRMFPAPSHVGNSAPYTEVFWWFPFVSSHPSFCLALHLSSCLLLFLC